MPSSSSTEAVPNSQAKRQKDGTGKNTIWIPEKPTYIEGSIKKFPGRLHSLIKRECLKPENKHIICSAPVWPKHHTLFQRSPVRSSTWALDTGLDIEIGRFKCEHNRQLIVVQHKLACDGRPALIKFTRNTYSKWDDTSTSYWAMRCVSGWDRTQSVVRRVAPRPETSIPPVIADGNNNDNDKDDDDGSDGDAKMEDPSQISSQQETTIETWTSTADEPVANKSSDDHQSVGFSARDEHPLTHSASQRRSKELLLKKSTEELSEPVMVIELDAETTNHGIKEELSQCRERSPLTCEQSSPLTTLSKPGGMDTDGRKPFQALMSRHPIKDNGPNLKSIHEVLGGGKLNSKSQTCSILRQNISVHKTTNDISAQQQISSPNAERGMVNAIFTSPPTSRVFAHTATPKSPSNQTTVEFVFKKAENEPVLRRRPYVQCKSVKMLYSQAVAAEIAASDTTLLFVKVAEQSPRTVVKDDHEDFEGVKTAIGKAEELVKERRDSRIIEVVVTPMTWSNE